MNFESPISSSLCFGRRILRRVVAVFWISWSTMAAAGTNGLVLDTFNGTVSSTVGPLFYDEASVVGGQLDFGAAARDITDNSIVVDGATIEISGGTAKITALTDVFNPLVFITYDGIDASQEWFFGTAELLDLDFTNYDEFVFDVVGVSGQVSFAQIIFGSAPTPRVQPFFSNQVITSPGIFTIPFSEFDVPQFPGLLEEAKEDVSGITFVIGMAPGSTLELASIGVRANAAVGFSNPVTFNSRQSTSVVWSGLILGGPIGDVRDREEVKGTVITSLGDFLIGDAVLQETIADGTISSFGQGVARLNPLPGPLGGVGSVGARATYTNLGAPPASGGVSSVVSEFVSEYIVASPDERLVPIDLQYGLDGTLIFEGLNTPAGFPLEGFETGAGVKASAEVFLFDVEGGFKASYDYSIELLIDIVEDTSIPEGGRVELEVEGDLPQAQFDAWLSQTNPPVVRTDTFDLSGKLERTELSLALTHEDFDPDPFAGVVLAEPGDTVVLSYSIVASANADGVDPIQFVDASFLDTLSGEPSSDLPNVTFELQPAEPDLEITEVTRDNQQFNIKMRDPGITILDGSILNYSLWKSTAPESGDWNMVPGATIDTQNDPIEIQDPNATETRVLYQVRADLIPGEAAP
ncbi:MAG: hypothetical protein AAGJ79_06145 [Verrucomicrobiota bacterium]